MSDTDVVLRGMPGSFSYSFDTHARMVGGRLKFGGIWASKKEDAPASATFRYDKPNGLFHASWVTVDPDGTERTFRGLDQSGKLTTLGEACNMFWIERTLGERVTEFGVGKIDQQWKMRENGLGGIGSVAFTDIVTVHLDYVCSSVLNREHEAGKISFT